MPQEPQQVTLEELTRLYDNRVHNLLKFNAGMEDAFPALRDELVRLRERDKNAEAKQRRAMLKNISIRHQLDEAKGLLELLISNEFFCAIANEETEEGSLAYNVEQKASAFLASLAGRDGGHSSELKDTQEDANQFGSDWGQLTKALGAHGEESCPITGKDTHEDIHERAMQRIRDLVAEEGEAGDLREQLETAKMWIATSANRFETIRETHPSISLDHDISNLRGFLTGKEIKSSFRVLNEGSTEDHPTGILTIQQEQPTQGEVAWHDVTKSLPEYMTSALVWCPANKNIYCAYCHFYAGSQDPESKPIWCYFTQEETITTLKEEVTHWTTLPTPPQEVEGGSL